MNSVVNISENKLDKELQNFVKEKYYQRREKNEKINLYECYVILIGILNRMWF